MECQIPECAKQAKARGWCPMHYTRWLKHGDPLYERPRPTPEERFWRNVDRRGPDECWPWLGGKVNGYGWLNPTYAHRFSYELLVGPIPAGLQIDHVCHGPDCRGTSTCLHRRCVNPAHLNPTTAGENTLRSPRTASNRNAAKRECLRGHPFTPENTKLDTRGQRVCRACKAMHARELRRRHGDRLRAYWRDYYRRRKTEDA